MQNLIHSLKLGVICPVYLLAGDEQLLMEEQVQRIISLASPDGSTWNIESYQGGDISPDDVVMNASCGGFMGMRRIIVVRDINWLKRTKKNARQDEEIQSVDMEKLIVYAADPNPDTVLILMFNGNVPSNSRLLKAVNKGGRAAFFPLVKGTEKEKWLENYLRAAGKKPGRGVIPYLALMSGEGLLTAKSEADKLILYTEGRAEIIMDDARETVSHSALAGAFDLTDLMAKKNGAAAAEVFRRLLLQGEAPQKILAMLGTQYHNTLAVKDLMSKGYSSYEAASRLSMNSYAAKKCSEQAAYYTNRQLSAAIELLLNADIAQKRGEGDMKDLLEVAILRICSM